MLASLREQQDAFGVGAPATADCHARRYVRSADPRGHARSNIAAPVVVAPVHAAPIATARRQPTTAKTTDISGSTK